MDERTYERIERTAKWIVVGMIVLILSLSAACCYQHHVIEDLTEQNNEQIH